MYNKRRFGSVLISSVFRLLGSATGFHEDFLENLAFVDSEEEVYRDLCEKHIYCPASEVGCNDFSINMSLSWRSLSLLTFDFKFGSRYIHLLPCSFR